MAKTGSSVAVVKACRKGVYHKETYRKRAYYKRAYHKGTYHKESSISSRVGIGGKVGISGKVGIRASSSKNRASSIVYSRGVGE